MSNMGMKELGELLRAARERRGVRAYDLSYLIGQNPSWLSRIEAGSLTHPPAPDVMQALSEALNVPQSTMLEALGYHVLEEESPTYDETAATIARAVRDWTPRQKKLLMDYIEVVSEALDAYDPPIDDDQPITGAA